MISRQTILGVALGGALLALVASCASVVPAMTGGTTRTERREWLLAHLPEGPVSDAEAHELEDEALRLDYEDDLWLRLSHSAQARQYRLYRLEYLKTHRAGYTSDLPLRYPPPYFDVPLSELRLLAHRGDPFGALRLGEFYYRIANTTYRQFFPSQSGVYPVAASAGSLPDHTAAWWHQMASIARQRARLWMRLAAQRRVRLAEYFVAVLEEEGFGGPARLHQAMHWFMHLAATGNLSADCQLVRIYQHGPAASASRAYYYERLAARQTLPSRPTSMAKECHRHAEFELAMAYRRGRGTAVNPVRSRYWLVQADQARDPQALVYEREHSRTLAGLRALARGGSALAALAMGYAERSGTFVHLNTHLYFKPSPTRSARWFRRAALLGNVQGQFVYGIDLLQGSGVPENNAAGIMWVRKAARQGMRSAQRMLGNAYLNGSDVAANYARALYWLRRAAEGGSYDALNSLGYMYSEGRGVAQNDRIALHYFKLAAPGSAAAGENLQILRNNMRLSQQGHPR